MTAITADTLSPILHNQIPVITTELLAQLYGADVKNIQNNYARNTARFVPGKHFFKIEGDELRELKHRPSLSGSVRIAPNVRSLILWTERGAARHAKMLETDQAWDVFEKLEDCYFNQHKKAPIPAARPIPKRHTIITYYENDSPVASMPLMPGEIIMSPESSIECARRAGYVMIPCDEAEKLTLEELNGMIATAKKLRDDWQNNKPKCHR